MLSRFLLLAACYSLSLSAAMAQSPQGPAYFLRHPTYEPPVRVSLLPGGWVPARPAVAAIPTRSAAASDALPSAPAAQPVPVEEPAPRHDLTGSRAYPPYDAYQNLPEAYRKHTLPDVWTPPLPVQLLRSAFGH